MHSELGWQTFKCASLVLEFAGQGKHIQKSIGTMTDAFLPTEGHGSPAGGAEGCSLRADTADQVTAPAAGHRRLADRLHADRALQRGLEVLHEPSVGGKQRIVLRLEVRSF